MEDFDANNYPVLVKAARENSATDIELILAAAPTPEVKKIILNAIEDSSGLSALHIACQNSCFEIVRLLMREDGCDVNLQDRTNGNSALHFAMQVQNFSIIDDLIAIPRVDRNLKNDHGETPFHLLIKSAVFEKWIIQLYSEKFSVSMKNNSGHTPFHVAIINHLLKEVEAILEVDRSLADQTTGNGETPLWLALERSDKDMFQLLLKHEANVEVVHERFGTSVLWLAVDLQQEWAVDLLLSKGISTNSIFEFGKEDCSSFILSLARGNKSIIDKLVNESDLKSKILFGLISDSELKDVGPNWMDEEGNSPLHLAVLSDSSKVVEMVMSKFTPGNGKKNKDGKTAEDIAAERGISQIVDLFKINNKCCMGSAIDKMRRIDELSSIFPVFVEQEQINWFRQTPNDRNDITISDLERHIVGPLSINWNSGGSFGSKLPSLAERQLHLPETDDDPSTSLAKSILLVMHQVEEFLNIRHPLFQHLNVAFFPVGSIVEGTKVGPLDEMDFMVAFNKLNGLYIRDEQSLLMAQEELQKLDNEQVKRLFDKNGKLDLLQLFLIFVHAIGEAMDNLVEMPNNLSKYKQLQCHHQRCWDSNYVVPMKKQCSVMLGTPCVCFTKVGVGLNFMVLNPGSAEATIFTVDLVLSFQAMYKQIANGAQLRQSVVKHLLNKLPCGWREFLFSYMKGDRAGLGQFAGKEDEEQIIVGIKMIGFTGNFVLRPPLNLNVHKMFINENIRKAYSVLKLLRYLTDSKVKSYDIKKVMFSLEQQVANFKDDVYGIVKIVLEHKEMIGKFESIHTEFRKYFSRIDLSDFPKVIDGVKNLHFISKLAEQIQLEIVTRRKDFLHVAVNMSEQLGLGKTYPALEMIDEEAFSIHSKYPLHWATESPVRPSLRVIKNLVARGCSLYNTDLSGRSAVHMLICNSQTSAKCLNSVLKRVPEMEPIKVCNALQACLTCLAENNSSCGREIVERNNTRLLSIFNILTTTMQFVKRQNVSIVNLGELLTFACQLGKFQFADIMLTSKNDMNTNIPSTEHDMIPLDYASRDGNITILQKLVETGNINRSNRFGWIPLMWASRGGHHKAVRILISKGAEIDKMDKSGDTALIFAAQNGHTDAAQALLLAGANPDLAISNATTPLRMSCQNGHVDIVKLLLRFGANIRLRNRNGNGILHFACMNVDITIIKLLLDSGAEINEKNKKGMTPLFVACSRGPLEIVDHDESSSLHLAYNLRRLEVIKLLVNHGANLNSRDQNRCTPLIQACRQGYLDVVILLLLTKGVEVVLRDQEGRSGFHVACQNGHRSIAEQLLAFGVDVNSTDQYSVSGLHLACYNGHLDVVKGLVNSKADLNLRNSHHQTPLISACIGGHIKVVKFLLESGAGDNVVDKDGWTPLTMACSEGHLDIAEMLLIAKGANVDMRDNNGKNCLHVACQNGRWAIAEKLLAFGMDVNSTDKLSNTALHLACRSGNIEAAKWLVNQKADLNPRNIFLNTPLMYACRKGHFEVVVLLLEAEVEINATNVHGQTALFCACMEGHLKTIELLLVTKGVNVGINNNNGRSCLHVACQNSDWNIAEKLLTFGLDINSVDNDGNTALHMACYLGQHATVKWLLNNKADINLTNRDHYTPLMFTCTEGHFELAKLLLELGADKNVINKEGKTAKVLAMEKDFHEIVQML